MVVTFTIIWPMEVMMSVTRIAAAFYRGNRSFEIEQIETRSPKANEVSIRVAYCGICGTDMHVFHGDMDDRAGSNRIIGHESSGVIVDVGDRVENLARGQRVVVRPLDACNDCPACASGLYHICHNLNVLGIDVDGAMQEIWNVPAHTVHRIPEYLDLKHAALVEPVAVACHAVRMSKLHSGEGVVVIGGGPIGILVAIVARNSGTHVTISEVNTKRLGIAGQLGFSTINPTREDIASTIHDMTRGKGADVIFEVSGTQSGIDAMTAIAASRARIVMVAIHASKPRIDLFRFFWQELELIGTRVYEPEDYESAIDLVANGQIHADEIITEITPLARIQQAFDELDHNTTAMKSLVSVGDVS